MSSLASQYDVGKVKLKPKRHHGYNVLLFILGTLFPPLAVAARFGIGTDFFLNLILTIAGYIPGHVHNFYIQNIRNNKNHKRTPKWAQRYGLVDTSTIKKHEKRSQWASRFNERNPHSTLEDAQLEEGQMPGGSSSSLPTTPNPIRPQGTGLWNPEDEQYYNASDSGSLQSGSRWRYPANFDDAMPAPAAESSSSRKKKVKKDRHARTEDAYSMPAEEGRRRKKKKRSSRRESAGGEYAASTHSLPSAEGPEDAEGAYGRSNGTGAAGAATGGARTDDDVFRHEF